jgi:tetratricopeptide (TPR) repeat protein
MYYESRRLPKAEAYWLRASELNRANTDCRRHLVDLYRRTGRGRRALPVYEQLRKIHPGNAIYHLETGVLLAGLKRFDAAEEAIRKALALAPKRAPPYRCMVQLLLLRDQKPVEAKALAEKLVELEPTAKHHALLGRACLRNRDRAGALAAMKRAAGLAPSDGQIQKAYRQLLGRQ